ncbi:outer membrane beta-barrel protein [Flavobacteriaceae bacterium XHP0103]|uniref:hypothetical protein n=1 Tax=Marixanthotalea marina TaxID=2844359 RepID=UPI002989A23D|nr:hypothetical protein [Marixanthotalea marina]MBU3820702.1 outer membrane beta-barrel protein [Marixanthotalea marina]
MGDKKHIDRLFQEAFKDFEETPNDAVWEHIEAKLKEKKKRRVIPIWWRYGGVAALLMLMLSVGIGFFNNDASVETPIQVVDSDENTDSNENTDNNSNTNPINNALENKDALTDTNSSEDDLKNTLNSKENASSAKKETLFNNNRSSSIATASSNEDKSSNPSKENKLQQLKNANESSAQIANNTEENFNSSSNTNDATIDEERVKDAIKNTKSNDAIADTGNEEKTAVSNKENQKTIEEAIEASKHIDDEEKEKLNRWRIAPNAAPVFFNTLGQGSSIDPQFDKNSKISETNMSYGVIASYAINDKLRVRSGVNKVNLGYSTNDVVVLQSLSGRSSISFLSNVKPELSNSPDDISVLSSQNFANKSSEAFATTSGINTSINQSFSFIEIPLEVEYALLDKKLGVNVIGGFSSFFLSDNELTSNFGSGETSIGEANNINDVSYSANFGLGLNYKFSKKINLNVEPMFKYQINTFDNTSGDFKPYFIGVYTGFGIKF